MITGTIPAASVYATWLETMEIRDIDDNSLWDLSSVVEIKLVLRDPHGCFEGLTLTKSKGQITIPTAGIIQWRAEAGQMGTLTPRLYEMILLMQDTTDTTTLILGTVSVIE